MTSLYFFIVFSFISVIVLCFSFLSVSFGVYCISRRFGSPTGGKVEKKNVSQYIIDRMNLFIENEMAHFYYLVQLQVLHNATQQEKSDIKIFFIIIILFGFVV